MTVTAIRQLSPGRLCVELEDGSQIRTTLGVVTELRLYAGRELDEEAVEALRSASRRALARELSLEIVSRRPLSSKELRDKLLQKGADENTALYCVQWLTENGFLDDARYAESVVRHYAAKGYGAGRVRAELSRRGIDRELRDEALSAMPESDDKLDRFIEARLRDPEDREQIQKISSALCRRGYSWEEIRSALRRHSAQTEDD